MRMVWLSLLLLASTAWSLEPGFEYRIVNQSHLANNPEPFQQSSPVVLGFCFPVSGLILAQCLNEVGEGSFPGEDIPQSPEIFMRHHGVVHQFGVRKPYLEGYCDEVLLEWKQLLKKRGATEVCLEASYVSSESPGWLVWQLEKLKAGRSSWSYFQEGSN